MNEKNELELLIEKVKLNVINNLNKIKEINSQTEDSASAIDKLYNSTKKISESSNQVNIISEILSGIKHFCSRAAIFLIKDDKLQGWGGAGFTNNSPDINDKDVKKMFFSITADTVFKEVVKSKKVYYGNPDIHNDNHLVFNRFGGEVPDSIFVLPFFVKGKPQAILYADSFGEVKIKKKEIQILLTFGEMSLDLLPLKQKIITRVKTQKYEEELKDKPILLTEESEPIKKKRTKKLSDAERLAKVIVNDIILYNKKQVEDAREANKLFELLGDTILQSKEIYTKKFEDITPFETQLLETLARGRREALKGYKFESI